MRSISNFKLPGVLNYNIFIRLNMILSSYYQTLGELSYLNMNRKKISSIKFIKKHMENQVADESFLDNT